MSILNVFFMRIFCRKGDSPKKVISKIVGNWKLVCGVALACCFLHSCTPFFERTEKGWLDLSITHTPITADASVSNQIVLVVVDGDLFDDAHNKLFSGAGGKTTTDGLKQLVMKVASFAPLAIGVDINTSDSRFAKLADDADLKKMASKIVWSRPAVQESEGGYELAKVLGSDPHWAVTGATVLPDSSRDIVRRFFVNVKQVGADTPVKTLPFALCQAAGKQCDIDGQSTEKHILFQSPPIFSEPGPDDSRWAGEVTAMPTLQTVLASELLSENPGSAGERIKGKIAIIGYCFDAAKDKHLTPMGQKYGLEIMGDAVANVLKKGHHELEPFQGLVIDILFGFVYSWFAYRISLLKNPYVALFVLPSLMNFTALNLQLFLNVSLDFSIMLWGLQAHDLFEAERKEKKLANEIAELNEKLCEERARNKATS